MAENHAQQMAPPVSLNAMEPLQQPLSTKPAEPAGPAPFTCKMFVSRVLQADDNLTIETWLAPSDTRRRKHKSMKKDSKVGRVLGQI